MKIIKSELKDRNLRFDGISEIKPDQLARFFLLGVPPEKLRIDGDISEVSDFNHQVGELDQLRPIHYDDSIVLDMSWQLPEEYQKLDLSEYMANTFEIHLTTGTFDKNYMNTGIARIIHELNEVEKRGMTEFMRTVIYIIDQLREKNVVWGVGRGSSCASYLLFLIGLHVVDCVIMDVPLEEFFHE